MLSGTSEVRHFHQQAWQFFFVLSGQATLEIAGDRKVMHVGEGIQLMPGVPH